LATPQLQVIAVSKQRNAFAPKSSLTVLRHSEVWRSEIFTRDELQCTTVPLQIQKRMPLMQNENRILPVGHRSQFTDNNMGLITV
jgi:hypothetical protein